MVFKKIIFQNRYVKLETPPFMEKNILNFHFDYFHPSLSRATKNVTFLPINTLQCIVILSFLQRRLQGGIVSFLSFCKSEYKEGYYNFYHFYKGDYKEGLRKAKRAKAAEGRKDYYALLQVLTKNWFGILYQYKSLMHCSIVILRRPGLLALSSTNWSF